MPSEREKMVAGELYNASDPELTAARTRARELTRAFNISPEDQQQRRDILAQLFRSAGPKLWVEPPFFCDYGFNISVGENVFFNFNCVVLDCAPVIIGDNALFGPAVQIYTATHPLSAAERRIGLEFALPVNIGSDTWIGGGAIILPGVTIGDRTVVGAGSVVTRDLPPGVFAAGNPARVVRELGE